MNWDWDKLQEKRQRQARPQQPVEEKHDTNAQPEEPRSNAPRNNGGNGNGGGKVPFGNPFKQVPSFSLGGKALWLVPAVLVVAWLLSGIYIINPDEEGLVLRFGRYDRSVGSGPHYHLPIPFESVEKLPVTRVLRAEVGFRSSGQDKAFQQGRTRVIPEEASTLTGDENIVNVQFSVQYKISDAVEFRFNVRDPQAVVRSAAEAAMREVIGKSLIDSAITDGKIKIQTEATELLQLILNRYQIGVQVLAVQLQDVHPPQEVLDAFKDVASAREDKSRIINQAEAYRNDLLPKARGRAAELQNQAEAYRATRVQNAEGEAQRFLALLGEYEKAKDVTRKRLYYEAMEDILTHANDKIILPQGTGEHILPFLPLQPQAQGKGGDK
ncbi:MAG: FtsH protease activity modulator HflK [Desulfovibrionaceae bacterium]|nr:FtsH protease activity modulator HflK [Desulfovibrionaceae bacterium]